jgi:TatD family-associated radical SAM protein
MEDEKKVQGEGQGRKRRQRRRHKHGGNGGQAQNAQPAVKQEQPKKQGVQPQNQGKKPAEQQKPQPQNQNKKNKGKKNEGGQKQENANKKDTYVYILDGTLYLNLTNKCSNACDFCVRNERTSYYGHYLWLTKGEPTAEKVISAINACGDLSRFKEAVFCGFGEPTYRMEELVAVCDYLHEKGLSTRLNTNGQGSLVNKRDIVPELKGKIDLVNVSLNASCYEKYQKICRSQFREAGFDGMIEFAKACKRQGVPVRFSIVDCIGEEEVNACKALSQSLGIPLYIRDYITDS